MEQKKFEYNDVNYDKMVHPSMCDMNYMNMSQPNICDLNYMNTSQQTMMCPPIQECPQERVCHRYICYEVPHVLPCNTRIINHHVYRHTYTPCYTSCEENVVSNIYDQKCCF